MLHQKNTSPLLAYATAQKLLPVAAVSLLIILYIYFFSQETRNVVKMFDSNWMSFEGVLPKTEKFKKQPLILTWTNFFSSNLASEMWENLRGCEYQCAVTDDRRVAASADVIVFHIRDLNASDLPQNRSVNQLFVFFLYESPENTGSELNYVPKDFFNITMTYRRDSDVYSPYGMLKKIDNSTPDDQIWDWEEVKEIAKSKNELVFQLVSNCGTPSKRELYVEQLSNYIPITQRGACSDTECDKKCAENLTKSHYFYLAFENSVCFDYITEKLFSRIEDLLVPIVLKKSLYSGILPEGSYIAADDFESPKKLAHYLKYLAQNTSAYLRYLEWTKHYQKSTYSNWFCPLCKYLREYAEENGSRRIIENIGLWWYDDGQCIKDYALKLLRNQI